MEGFTIIDAVAAGVIVISAILAYSRGFVREILSIAGWVAAAILAFIFAPRAVPASCAVCQHPLQPRPRLEAMPEGAVEADDMLALCSPAHQAGPLHHLPPRAL